MAEVAFCHAMSLFVMQWHWRRNHREVNTHQSLIIIMAPAILCLCLMPVAIGKALDLEVSTIARSLHHSVLERAESSVFWWRIVTATGWAAVESTSHSPLLQSHNAAFRHKTRTRDV
jgi:hypothetical protein